MANLDKNEVKERVLAYKGEMLDRLGKLVAINSEEGTPEENAPFGIGPATALRTALAMLDEDGFATTNVDNYAGYAEMGQGEEVVGVIGHLDIVPADKNDGWDQDPFTMVEKDGKLIGRGVADDKGAMVASMIAMKIIKDMELPLKRRVRLIMGTNEETGSRCLEYYVKKEGSVDYGFTPDGDFPGIYGEKGILQGEFKSKETKILDIKATGAKNIVSGKVTAKVAAGSYDADKLAAYFEKSPAKYEVANEGDVDTITVIGNPAHASTPDLGINAINHFFVAMKEAGFVDPLTDFFCEKFGLETDGTSFAGQKVEDDFGGMTLNIGVMDMTDGVITGSIDVRFPVTLNSEKVLALFAPSMNDDRAEVSFGGAMEPLFIAPDSALVTSLYDAYVEITGDTETKPMVIGGGTYAKEIKNTMAFGCAFPGVDNRIHNSNEWVGIDELLLQAEIYVHAIMKLVEI